MHPETAIALLDVLRQILEELEDIARSQRKLAKRPAKEVKPE